MNDDIDPADSRPEPPPWDSEPFHIERLTSHKITVAALPFLRGGTKGDGKILPLLANAKIVLRDNPAFFNLRFDLFSQKVFCGEHEIKDFDYLRITDWVQHQGVHCDVNAVSNAIRLIAEECPFHQVRDYFKSLPIWDGKPRLETVLMRHGGAADTPASRVMMRKWHIQAIARIFQPGCKADSMLILAGTQGLKKSFYFDEISKPWFKDDLSDLMSKDAKQELRGQWIIEMAELSAMDRTDVKHLKAFLTVKADHYRDSYGRTTQSYPRQCVFAGTVNPGGNGFLRDPTGARRFWIIEVDHQINHSLVAAERPQIWAEAYQYYREKEAWWVEDETIAQDIKEIQNNHYESDAWEDIIAEHILGIFQVTTREIFEQVIKIDTPAKWDRVSQMRIGNVLTSLGWKKKKGRIDGGKPINVYIKGGNKEPELPLVPTSEY